MSTATPRLNLTKPAVGEQYNVATENTNKDLIDSYVSGTADKQAKGRIGYNPNAATNTLSATNTMFDLVAVNLVTGRSYLVEYQHNVDDGGASAANLPYTLTLKKSITSDSGTGGTTMDTAYTGWTAPLVDSGKTNMATFTFESAATETVNIKVTGVRAGGTDVSISVRRLSVYDVGEQV